MTHPTAILLMAYGGPDSLADVAPYLADVRHGRPTPPELIAEISARYAAIGGKSPLLSITNKQAAALERDLNAQASGNFRVYVGMRHWNPYIREVVGRIKADGCSRIIALCMTPFSSRMTTGAYFEQLAAAIEEHYADNQPEVRQIGAWFDNAAYIRALAGKVEQGLQHFDADQRDQVQVIFTAHSLPAALADQGDPYPEQFKQLAAQVAEAAKITPGQWSYGYQSAGASAIRWLGPALEEMISRAAEQGQQNLLVAPIGFLTDHVEILYDIDIEARQQARGVGLQLERIPSLNADPLFIQALSQTILKESKHA